MNRQTKKKKTDLFGLAAAVFFILYFLLSGFSTVETAIASLNDDDPFSFMQFLFDFLDILLLLSPVILAVGMLMKKNRLILMVGAAYAVLFTLFHMGLSLLRNTIKLFSNFNFSFLFSQVLTSLPGLLSSLCVIVLMALLVMYLLKNGKLPGFVSWIFSALPIIILLLNFLSFLMVDWVGFSDQHYRYVFFFKFYDSSNFLLHYYPMLLPTLLCLGYTFTVGALTGADKSGNSKLPLLISAVGLALLLVGNVLSVGVAGLSMLLNKGYIFIFNGPWYMTILWLLTYIPMGLGFLLTPAASLKLKAPAKKERRSARKSTISEPAQEEAKEEFAETEGADSL